MPQVYSFHGPVGPGYMQPPSSACPALQKASCSPGQHPCKAGPNKTLLSSCTGHLAEMSLGQAAGGGGAPEGGTSRGIRCKENEPLGGGWCQNCVDAIGPTDLASGLLARGPMSGHMPLPLLPGTRPEQVNRLIEHRGTWALWVPPGPQHL